jgi:hypothetical protein
MWRSRHQKYALLGSAVAACVFAMGSAMGTIPVLAERANALALNGRFTSTAFAIKCCMAVMYVLFAERHRYYQTGSVFVLLCILLFLNITLRPCLVERIQSEPACNSLAALARDAVGAWRSDCGMTLSAVQKRAFHPKSFVYFPWCV